MNDEIQKLIERATQLFQQEKWDECIPVLTEHISLEVDSQLKAEAFSMRGVAYNNKGDSDRAVADFNEAVQLNPNDARAFHVRGVAYYNKSNYDRAIEDFNEAIRLNLDDVDDTFSYRGAAYCKKGDYDRAIEDFNEAIRLNPNDARALNNRGFSFYNKGDYDRALENFDKAVRLNPDRAETFNNRGAAYVTKGDYDRALKEFLVAYEKNKELKSEYAGIYIATRSKETFGDDEINKTEAFRLYSVLHVAITEIKRNQFYKPKAGKEVAHYTSLHTLKKLASKEGCFRLYNADYMNDPEEGRVFFEIMRGYGIENVEERLYRNKEKKPHRSPAYIGSFVRVDEKESKQKDKLFMWRTYGKHDGQEATGTCLIFKHEGANFASSPPLKIDAMAQMQGQKSSIRQPTKPALYNIAYRSDCTEKKSLSDALEALATSLGEINVFYEKLENTEQKEGLAQVVRELLDDIRFLFKANHYREEGEVRVVEVRYYNEEDMIQDEDGVQIDTQQIPPRFYLETHENFRFSEVILGPQARGEAEWKHWLKKRDEKLMVYKSEIPYGKPYP